MRPIAAGYRGSPSESCKGHRRRGATAWSWSQGCIVFPVGSGSGVEIESGEVCVVRCLPRRSDCHLRPATDAPDEGSGLARRGRSRLQHMSGSRGWRVSSLGPWSMFVALLGRAGVANRYRGRRDDVQTPGRDRLGHRECAHGPGARRDRCHDRQTQGVAHQREPGRGRGGRVGRCAGRDAAGGGDGADRAGVVADRGVLRCSWSSGVPSVVGQVG